MAHLVQPSAFRAGKTHFWEHNVLTKMPSRLTFAAGLSALSKTILKRRRLYLVKAALSAAGRRRVVCNLLYAPKIKVKLREHRSGAFARRILYRPYNWASEIEAAKEYVERRREKIAVIARRKSPQLNKLLSRRMFRGAAKHVWRRNVFNVSHVKKKELSRRRNVFNVSRLKKKKRRRHTKKINRPKRSTFPFFKVPASRKSLKKWHRKYRNHVKWSKKWKFDRIKRRRFSDKILSARLSAATRMPVKARAMNIFSFLASKNLLNYKTHQRHFWNYTYRRYRFQYKNYYDVVNGFFVIALIDNAETLLLSVLRATLPQIMKMRKFFRFLNTVIKNMPELTQKYQVFKIGITGKLAGGTKRTKFHSIGYGVLPMQTLSLSTRSNFLAYAHIYGEFGLKLLMSKDPSPKRAARWK